MLLIFYRSLLRARLCEHELFSVRSIAFISTVVKSPDETLDKYIMYVDNKRIWHQWPSEYYDSSGNEEFRGRVLLRYMEIWNFLSAGHFFKIIACAFWKSRQFSKRANFPKKIIFGRCLGLKQGRSNLPPVPPLIVLISACSRSFRRKGQDKVPKTIVWG